MALEALVQGSKASAFALTSNVAAADTVTIGDIVYVFAADPTGTPYEVDVGTDLDDSIGNLVAAINLSGTDDDEYGVGTVRNPYVNAAADLANDEIDLTARLKGDQINGLYLAATSPGANSIVALGVSFGIAAGGTDGSGQVADLVAEILDESGMANAYTIEKLTPVRDQTS